METTASLFRRRITQRHNAIAMARHIKARRERVLFCQHEDCCEPIEGEPIIHIDGTVLCSDECVSWHEEDKAAGRS